MRKSWKWLIAAVVILLCMRACGSKPAKTEKPAPTQTEQTETIPPLRTKDFYCGTWTVSAINTKGVEVPLEQAVAMGAEDFAEIQVVLTSEGKIYLLGMDSVDVGIWHLTEEGIRAGKFEISYKENRLNWPIDDIIVYFEKQSDDQTPPETIPAPTEAPTEPETTVPASGIRPEFKEAMDTYEAFYDDYCAIMRDYMKNPADLSLLGKYADMLTKAAQMDEKFNA